MRKKIVQNNESRSANVARLQAVIHDEFGLEYNAKGRSFSNGDTLCRKRTSESTFLYQTAVAIQMGVQFYLCEQIPAIRRDGMPQTWIYPILLILCLLAGAAAFQQKTSLLIWIQQGWKLISSTAFASCVGLYLDAGAPAAPSSKKAGKSPIRFGLQVDELNAEGGLGVVRSTDLITGADTHIPWKGQIVSAFSWLYCFFLTTKITGGIQMANDKIMREVMKEKALRNRSKVNRKLTNRETTQKYKKAIDDFCDWSDIELGIVRVQHILEAGFTKVQLIQEYSYYLQANYSSPDTIHNYLAPVCKGLGVGMEEIDHPRRDAGKIKRNTKLHQNAAAERQENSDKYSHFADFALRVGVRESAFLRLNINCLKLDENGDWYIEVRDKGGKPSHQLVFDYEMDFVRYCLTHDALGNPLKEEEKPFTEKDIGCLATSRYRIIRAQEIQHYFEELFEHWKTLPLGYAEREKARLAAEALKQEWIDKLVKLFEKGNPRASAQRIQEFRDEISRESRIVIRGGNRENAIRWNRPLSYERVSVKIASVYALSHWSDASTIKHYLSK